MIEKLKNLRHNLEQEKGKKNQLLEEQEKQLANIKCSKRILRNTLTAQTIIQTTAQQTQEQVEFQINDLVSLALHSIFDNPYNFKIEFVLKRGKTEAECYFVKGKDKIFPMMASGGGAVDVASFALRIALWKLAVASSCNTIILDEPFKFVSNDLQEKTGDMLKLLSERLGIQFIVITHNNAIIENADRLFKVEMKKGISKTHLL